MWNYKPYADFVSEVVRDYDIDECSVDVMLNAELDEVCKRGRKRTSEVADSVIASARDWLADSRMTEITVRDITSYRPTRLFFRMLKPRKKKKAD